MHTDETSAYEVASWVLDANRHLCKKEGRRPKKEEAHFEELQQNRGDSNYPLDMGLSSFTVIFH